MSGIAIWSLARREGGWGGLMRHCGVCTVVGLIKDARRRPITQEMAARHEQIGECAGNEQAMGVLLQPTIAHLGSRRFA